MSSKRQIGRARVFHLQNHGRIKLRTIFQHFKWNFDINWDKFEKRWADVFQIDPNATHFNPSQFCPSLSLLSFPVFWLSSSTVLSRYFIISVNSMAIWSMLKLPKIEWPSPFETGYPNLLHGCDFLFFKLYELLMSLRMEIPRGMGEGVPSLNVKRKVWS